MIIKADEFYKIRKVYGLSQQEWGDLLDLSHAQISRIESGKRELTLKIKRRLIEELQLTPEKLAKIFDIYETYKI